MKQTLTSMVYLCQIQSIKVVTFATSNFKSQEVKKTHMFPFHYGQMGGSRQNFQRPINVLKRGPITYCSITYEQHKTFYGFFGDGIVEDF